VIFLLNTTFQRKTTPAGTIAKNKSVVSCVEWGCTTGNAATVAHSTRKTTSGKDSVIEEQPLLLFM
jgi:hypothetical protein